MMSNKASCIFSKSIKIFSRKWSLNIICLLLSGNKRFSELERMLGNVSPKVLTETLNFLEKEGIVDRIVTENKPVRVFYSLTPRGRSLEKVIYDLIKWELSNSK